MGCLQCQVSFFTYLLLHSWYQRFSGHTACWIISCLCQLTCWMLSWEFAHSTWSEVRLRSVVSFTLIHFLNPWFHVVSCPCLIKYSGAVCMISIHHKGAWLLWTLKLPPMTTVKPLSKGCNWGQYKFGCCVLYREVVLFLEVQNLLKLQGN